MLIRFCASVLLSVVASLAHAQPADNAPSPQQSVIDRLYIALPPEVLGKSAVRRPIEELHRERCDQQAISDLGKALEGAGYRREAANALVSFSEQCRGHTPSLRTAINILLKLTDHEAALNVATALIAVEPHRDNGYFLRALAADKLGRTGRAIDDYTTAIDLFGDKDRISSISYDNLAMLYSKLGKHCEAAATIEMWVATNPVRNTTSQSQAVVRSYRQKGNCPEPKAGQAETFPVARPGQVIHVQAKVNGVTGTFVLDTGATYLSVRRSFADKAKLDVEQGSELTMLTANGPAKAKRALADRVQLRSLEARGVAAAVHDDKALALGANVDGLLGMSFLSRFSVTVDARMVRIQPRKL